MNFFKKIAYNKSYSILIIKLFEEIDILKLLLYTIFSNCKVAKSNQRQIKYSKNMSLVAHIFLFI